LGPWLRSRLAIVAGKSQNPKEEQQAECPQEEARPELQDGGKPWCGALGSAGFLLGRGQFPHLGDEVTQRGTQIDVQKSSIVLQGRDQIQRVGHNSRIALPFEQLEISEGDTGALLYVLQRHLSLFSLLP